MQEFATKALDEKREKFRQTAREHIKKVQDENKKAFDLKQKQERVYQLNDLVAIKRTQYGVGLKLKGMFFGSYKIVAVKDHGSDGPFKTSTVSEYMKPWSGSFEANEQSGGPNVGFESGGPITRHNRSG